jgi:hypothetical protein
MQAQSTRHIMLIEPAAFYANPETMGTNVYQIDKHEDKAVIYDRALTEFRGFRDKLVEHGVMVSTVRGYADSPDMLFPNWASTHADGTLVIYPMLSENRRAEHSVEMVALLSTQYDRTIDLTPYESQGQFLEATGSLALDRVNRVAYAGLSARTDEKMVRLWCEKMGFTPVIFETRSHTGLPIYHTDLVVFIGTEIAGIATKCILEPYRDTVLQHLSKTHEIVELTAAQQQAFCGNSLEVLGANNERYLVMSDTAFNALTAEQKATFGKHFKSIIHAPIPTIEQYGGGSARCLMMEMF